MTVCVCVSVCERRANICDPGWGGRPEMGADQVVKQSGGGTGPSTRKYCSRRGSHELESGNLERT